jgi:hypothetical protein
VSAVNDAGGGSARELAQISTHRGASGPRVWGTLWGLQTRKLHPFFLSNSPSSGARGLSGAPSGAAVGASARRPGRRVGKRFGKLALETSVLLIACKVIMTKRARRDYEQGVQFDKHVVVAEFVKEDWPPPSHTLTDADAEAQERNGHMPAYNGILPLREMKPLQHFVGFTEKLLRRGDKCGLAPCHPPDAANSVQPEEECEHWLAVVSGGFVPTDEESDEETSTEEADSEAEMEACANTNHTPNPVDQEHPSSSGQAGASTSTSTPTEYDAGLEAKLHMARVNCMKNGRRTVEDAGARPEANDPPKVAA